MTFSTEELRSVRGVSEPILAWRKWRREMRLSIAEAAAMANVSARWLHRIELGEVKPTVRTLDKLRALIARWRPEMRPERSKKWGGWNRGTRKGRSHAKRVIALVAVMVACASGASRLEAQAQCTPYLLCPYPAGGSGGKGGAGGRSGAGATGGAGGTLSTGGAGGNVPAGGLIVTSALSLDKRIVAAGGTLNAFVTYGNTGSSAIAVQEIRIAARGPGATHEGGPYSDLTPVLSGITIEPGAHATLEAHRTFTGADPAGQWEAYATHLDASGKWHDAPSERFQVVGGGGPVRPDGMSVGAQLWYIAPWAGTEVFRPGVDWANAYASGVDIWNPQFMAELGGLVVFRHMDTNATNFSKISSWSQRKLPTDPRNQEVYIDGSSPSSTTGLAIEWQIDLCNRARLDCWFTHPYLANNDYLTKQAQLIREKLDPALRVYVELSNEVWNGSFSAYQQAIDAGRAGGLPGSNEYYQGIAHEMFRALEMFQIYESVFGGSAMGSRVIRVFSESGNLDLTTQALRNVYASEHWNPHGQRIDMIALAPYIGNGVNGSSETLSRWKSEVDSKTGGQPITFALDNHVHAYDIPLLGCYEGGMHHLSNAHVWAANSAVYDGYVYMLDRFAGKMNGPCVLYTSHGKWESKGAWGLYDHVGQSIGSAHKARATRDWAAGKADRGRDKHLVGIAIVIGILVLITVAWLVLTRMYRAARSEDSQ